MTQGQRCRVLYSPAFWGQSAIDSRMNRLPLHAALKRGVLIVAANWPVVLIDFAVTSLYRLALSIPVFGGAVVVASLVGADMQSVIGEGVRGTADLVVGSLATAPLALAAFLVAIALVAIGGEAVLLVIKCGTFSVLVSADRSSGDIHRLPLGTEAFERAAAYRLDTVLHGATRFARRAVTLALCLGAGYVTVGTLYVVAVTMGLDSNARWTWFPAWPFVIFLATAVGVVVIAIVTLAYDLLRVIVISDDCSVSTAVGRLRAFVLHDARLVVGVFAVICGVQVLAAVVSLLATAGLAIVGYVPLFSLVFVPLQAAAWVMRGLLFEALGLAALATCQTQYRRFRESHRPDGEGVGVPVAGGAVDPLVEG